MDFTSLHNRSNFDPRFLRPRYIVALYILCVIWIVPGLIGHDPWKPDEAYTFGLVYNILKTGDWVIPTLAGEPFMEKPPLYFLTAALFAKLFSSWLPLHDAARLASGFYMALTFAFIGLAGRELYGRGYGWISVAALLGCVGLLVRSHQMITDVALLSGFAAGLYGLALSLRRPWLAGIYLGLGVGIGFMAKGLLAPGILGIIALMLPVLFRSWRRYSYLGCLFVAAIVALPWLLVWPYALYQRSSELFNQWFWLNNFARFLGETDLGPGAETGEYLRILPWYAWPAWPLALWTLWRYGRRGLEFPGIQLPLLTFVVMFAVLSIAADARELYALPMLLPLSLLAAYGVDSLRRGASSALDWFGIMTFGLIAIALWIGWVALISGHPSVISQRLHQYQPNFIETFRWGAFVISLLATVVWIAFVGRVAPSNRRALINWTSGITLIWVLASALWLPFVDAGKSYRSMIVSMKQMLPVKYNCMLSMGLGEPQRAMLEYFAGIITYRLEVSDDRYQCSYLLTQRSADDHEVPDGPWQQIWEGSRPGDNQERYRLYKRSPYPEPVL